MLCKTARIIGSLSWLTLFLIVQLVLQKVHADIRANPYGVLCIL